MINAVGASGMMNGSGAAPLFPLAAFIYQWTNWQNEAPRHRASVICHDFAVTVLHSPGSL
jgi:hypothetical protein